MLDVGTANAIQLRLVNTKPATPPVPAPAPPPAVPQGGQQNPAGQNPGARNAPAAGGASFLFDPPSLTQAKGSTFTVNVLVSGGQNVYSVPVQLSYDPNQLQVLNVSNGGFLSQDGQAVALAFRDDPASGTLQITASRPPGAGLFRDRCGRDPDHDGEITGTIRAGDYAGRRRDPAMQAIPMNGAEAAVTIQ